MEEDVELFLLTGYTEPLNKYAFTWDDLDAGQKKEAVAKGVDPWWRCGVWRKSSPDMADAQFKEFRAKNPKVIAIDSTTVKKAKIVGGQLVGKYRLAGRGFNDRTTDHSESDSPTCQPTTVMLCETVGLSEASWIVIGLDFSDAYFHILEEISAHRAETWMLLPLEITGGRRVWRRLFKEVQGEKGASRSWYLTLEALLQRFGFRASRLSRGRGAPARA